MRRYSILFAVVCIIFDFSGAPLNAETETGYVGVAVCKACHQDRYESFTRSVHGKKAIPGTPANRENCETCHGPGAAHATKGGKGTGIFAFNRNVPADERSARCLVCHEETKTVAFWDMSSHKSSGTSCDQCHSIHSGTEHGLKAGQPAVCFDCHRDIRARFNKQSHHPVVEEEMKCTLCHNPMGTFGKRMLKADSINELCYSCHSERRGPFMWEHPPVAENCLNCHTPHGSNHSDLLQRKAPLLCQSCHDVMGHPGDIYTSFETFRGPDTSSRIIARACLNCHTNIHGSNGPSARGSHFLR